MTRHQGNLFAPIRGYAAAARYNESGAKQAREETKARYVDWIAQKDKAASVRISIFRDVFRQDQRKPFDEACQSIGICLRMESNCLGSQEPEKVVF